MKILGYAVVSGAVLLLALPAAQAQSNTDDSSGAAPNYSLLPYTAVHKHTHVQKLTNGAVLRDESATLTARTSSGRYYHETHATYPLPEGQEPCLTVEIHDASGLTTTRWDCFSHEVIVEHRQPWSARPGQVARMIATPAGSEPPQERPGVRIEDLGTRTLAGVEAQGVRETTIVAPGANGNDQPLLLVHEVWTSREYSMPMLEIREDPRWGTMTDEVTSLDRAEPNPSLFEYPQGYKVREFFPGRMKEVDSPPAN